MKISPALVAKLAALVLFVVVIQVSGIEQVEILGGTADIVPLLVGAVGYFAGSMAGAVLGFSTGLLLDLALGSTLGATSLVLSVVGHFAGRLREERDPAHGLAPVAVAAGVTAGAMFGYVLVSTLTGGAPGLSVVREIALTVVLNALIALPFFALVRRVLQGDLRTDPTQRRRSVGAPPPRLSGTGGL